MTQADWFDFIVSLSALAAILYLGAWFFEASRARSLKRGHAALWKKPRKWQLIAFFLLWGFIVVGFVVLMLIERSR